MDHRGLQDGQMKTCRMRDVILTLTLSLSHQGRGEKGELERRPVQREGDRMKCETMCNGAIAYSPPSPGGRESEGGGRHVARGFSPARVGPDCRVARVGD